MKPAVNHPFSQPLPRTHAALAIVVAIVTFHAAYAAPGASLLMAICLYCVTQLARARTTRVAFYLGLTAGLGIYVPQASFLWNIFNFGATSLWVILASWMGLFVALARLSWRHFGPLGAVAWPFLWTGLEYFRSELYPLKFGWITPGYAFPPMPGLFSLVGVYGIGFLLLVWAAVVAMFPSRLVTAGASLLLAGLTVFTLPRSTPDESLLKAASPAATVKTMHVAGLQVQPTIADELAPLLDKLLREHAQAELILLSEYAFQTPPPAELRAWCRRTGRYLVAGGKEFIDERTFYNTAFVVDPRGEIVFRQPKCVPVQFFRDGVPAPEQHVWGSPWGKIGLCLCYDLAYRRVVDRLVALGAQAILVPTLDELHWGRQEHEHHARVAPVRAAEMGVPIFRIGSCGIPQLVDARGQTLATAPFPGEGAMIGGELQVGQAGRRPLDHRLAPLCVGVTGVLWPWLAFAAWRDRRAAALNLEPRDSSAA